VERRVELFFMLSHFLQKSVCRLFEKGDAETRHACGSGGGTNDRGEKRNVLIVSVSYGLLIGVWSSSDSF